MTRRTLFLCWICCLSLVSRAQNNNSPYSIIGIGDIEKSAFDRTSGMGHAGIALSSNRFFYQSNPASFSAIEPHFFYFEMATRFKSQSYSGVPVTDPTQSQSSDVQVKKMAIAIKPRPRWALSIGLMPYSTVNYSFSARKSIIGSSITADGYYEGSGSTNQFYITNSFQLTKKLSFGVQATYLFGQLKETETLSQGVTDSTLLTTRNIYLGSPFVKLGLQYKTKINSDWSMAMGLTASNKVNFTADYTLQVQNGYTIVKNTEFYKDNYFGVPASVTAGLAVIYKNAYTLAADVNRQNWSNLNYKGINYSLVNSQRISVGAEYSKKQTYLDQQFEKYFLQTGFFYNDSYLKINGKQLTDYGATFGAGMLLRRSGLGLQGAIEIGKMGTTENGLIKEKYTQFSITLSYRDFWVSRKMKKYD